MFLYYLWGIQDFSVQNFFQVHYNYFMGHSKSKIGAFGNREPKNSSPSENVMPIRRSVVAPRKEQLPAKY